MQGNSGAPVATTLRTIAAWLESHPEANVSTINFGEPPTIKVYCFTARDTNDVIRARVAIGGMWSEFGPKDEHDPLCRTRQEIAPGVVYEIAMMRAEAAA
jgi:hypothetical protein